MDIGMASIDLETLKMVANLLTPVPLAPIAPIAPVAPLDYTKGSEGAVSMAKDIAYLTKTLDEVKAQLQKITDTHVTLVDMANHIGEDNKKHTDEDKIIGEHEARLRALETAITRVMAWGAAVIVFMGIAEFAISNLLK